MMTWQTSDKGENADGDQEHRKQTRNYRHDGESGFRSYPSCGGGSKPDFKFDGPRLTTGSLPQGIHPPSDSRGRGSSRSRNLHGRSPEAERPVHVQPAFHCESDRLTQGELMVIQQANSNDAPEAASVQAGEVDLEATDLYLKRAKADVH